MNRVPESRFGYRSLKRSKNGLGHHTKIILVIQIWIWTPQKINLQRSILYRSPVGTLYGNSNSHPDFRVWKILRTDHEYTLSYFETVGHSNGSHLMIYSLLKIHAWSLIVLLDSRYLLPKHFFLIFGSWAVQYRKNFPIVFGPSKGTHHYRTNCLVRIRQEFFYFIWSFDRPTPVTRVWCVGSWSSVERPNIIVTSKNLTLCSTNGYIE